MGVSNPPMGGGSGGGGTGPAGASAADIWRGVTNQPNATDADFLAAITGADGQDGVDGQDGADGDEGMAGSDGIDGVDGADGVDGIDGAPGFTVIPFIFNGPVTNGRMTASFPLPVDVTIERAQVAADSVANALTGFAVQVQEQTVDTVSLDASTPTSDIPLNIDADEGERVRLVASFAGSTPATNAAIALKVVTR